MKKQFFIGNITKVRWHYALRKHALNSWGHMRETFDDTSIIKKQHPYLKNAFLYELDTSMNYDKCYAYVSIDKDKNNIIVRNIFDNKHEKGFDQKNTYFKDEIFYDLFLYDTSNLLDEYLNLGELNRLNNDLLYFCVEYEPKHEIDFDLLLYCSDLERTKFSLEDKLTVLNIPNVRTNKRFFSYFW
jgi:hypothetical protein